MLSMNTGHEQVIFWLSYVPQWKAGSQWCVFLMSRLLLNNIFQSTASGDYQPVLDLARHNRLRMGSCWFKLFVYFLTQSHMQYFIFVGSYKHLSNCMGSKNATPAKIQWKPNAHKIILRGGAYQGMDHKSTSVFHVQWISKRTELLFHTHWRIVRNVSLLKCYSTHTEG